MFGMLSNGLCFARPFNPSSPTADVVLRSLALPAESTTPERFMLLSLTGLNYYGSQLITLYQQQHSSMRPQHGARTCHGAADACINVSNSSSGAGNSTCAGGSSSNGLGSSASGSSSSSSSAVDPWEAAEALLLCRADMMQSKAESAAHLATMLRQAGKVYLQHWQQLGYPVCLHPLGFSEQVTTDPPSSTCKRDSSGDDSRRSDQGMGCGSTSGSSDGHAGTNGSSGSSSSSGSNGSSGHMGKDLTLTLLCLLDAVHLLLDVVLHKPGSPAMQLHASATSQMLLSAAAAALGLYGSTAAYVVDRCLTAACALLRSQPCPASKEAAFQQAEACVTANTLDPLLHNLEH
jgi:hypothetical protein